MPNPNETTTHNAAIIAALLGNLSDFIAANDRLIQETITEYDFHCVITYFDNRKEYMIHGKIGEMLDALKNFVLKHRMHEENLGLLETVVVGGAYVSRRIVGPCGSKK